MSAIGRALVTISLLVLNSENDQTHSLASVWSSVSSFYQGTPRSVMLNLRNDAPDVEIDGLILARKGSKGIAHKNVALLNGHPLIYYALMAMMRSKVFTRIWISTDDPLVSEYVTAFRNNATASTVPVNIHNRAWYTATDEATSLVAVQEFLNHHPEIKTIGLVQATSPLIQHKFLISAAQLMKTSKADSVFSVTRQFKFKWSDVGGQKGAWTKPLNFDPSARPRRQDWQGELVENGMFYFMKAELVSEGLLQGKRSLYYEVPKESSVEIDSAEDLEYAEILMKKLVLQEMKRNCSHKCEL